MENFGSLTDSNKRRRLCDVAAVAALSSERLDVVSYEMLDLTCVLLGSTSVRFSFFGIPGYECVDTLRVRSNYYVEVQGTGTNW